MWLVTVGRECGGDVVQQWGDGSQVDRGRWSWTPPTSPMGRESRVGMAMKSSPEQGEVLVFTGKSCGKIDRHLSAKAEGGVSTLS